MTTDMCFDIAIEDAQRAGEDHLRIASGQQLGLVHPFIKFYKWDITMENHHAINGKTHYFDWAIFHVANFVCLSGRWSIE